ncbi:MAG TPA: D-2-hydroxyacid dehydrogenase [Ramlibacter sp.]|nr:D-2-hydroxyacid dehydrogenase [Ramlibacter sp.]
MHTLLLSKPTHDEYRDRLLQAAAGELRFVVSQPGVDLPQQQLDQVDLALMSLDVIGKSGKTDLSPELQAFTAHLYASRQLKWLHVPTAGADRPVFLDMMKRGARLTSSSGANAEAVAHSALTGFMVLGRGALTWIGNQRERRWQPIRGPQSPQDLRGQTAIVAGQGPIGQAIARLLEAIGLTVLKLRNSPQPGDAQRGTYGYGDIAALAPKADWIILSCPLSDATRNLVDARVLAALPPGAKVINVGRGGTLDEAALADAVRSGHIGGAYLDVFVTEPLPGDSPLWDLPNVLLSPHCSGATPGHRLRAIEMFLDNLPRWREGKALVNEVYR